MGIKDKFKKSARETSKKITDGVLPAQHLGEQSYETINQEIFSLRNTKPAFRAGKWDSRFDKVKESFDLKETEEVVMLLSVGYRDESQQMTTRGIRKTYEEVVIELWNEEIYSSFFSYCKLCYN